MTFVIHAKSSGMSKDSGGLGSWGGTRAFVSGFQLK